MKNKKKQSNPIWKGTSLDWVKQSQVIYPITILTIYQLKKIKIQWTEWGIKIRQSCYI